MIPDSRFLALERRVLQLEKVSDERLYQIARMYDVIVELYAALKEQDEFHTTEILKARIDNMTYLRKPPYYEVNEIKNSFNGLVQFVNDRLYPDKKRNSKYE